MRSDAPKAADIEIEPFDFCEDVLKNKRGRAAEQGGPNKRPLPDRRLRHARSGTRVPLATLLAISLLMPATASPAAPLSIKPEGAVQTLFDASAQRCEDKLLPDSPARAYRNAEGKMVLITSYQDNWSLQGDSFESISPICALTLPYAAYKGSIRGKLWIQGTYTEDGRTVFGIASESLRSDAHSKGCQREGHQGRCWVNQLRAVQSTDGGRTFQVKEPLATFGEDYPASGTKRFGVFTSSNIVKLDSAWYTVAYVIAEGRQERSNCLLRSDDVSDPRSWRVWDGDAFSIDPMRFDRPCKGFFPSSPVRSLSYLTKRKQWVAVVGGTLKLSNEGAAKSGFFYLASSDLKNWSKPVRIMDAPLRPRTDSREEVWYYPSLFDPRSHSRNFETIDNTDAVITFTSRRLRNGVGTMDRDIKFVRVRVD